MNEINHVIFTCGYKGYTQEKKYRYKWKDIYKDFKIHVPSKVKDFAKLNRDKPFGFGIRFTGKWVLEFNIVDIDKWFEVEAELNTIGLTDPIANERYHSFYIFSNGNPYTVYVVMNPFETKSWERIKKNYDDILCSYDEYGNCHIICTDENYRADDLDREKLIGSFVL